MIRRVPLKRARIRPSASPVQSTRGAAGAAVADRTAPPKPQKGTRRREKARLDRSEVAYRQRVKKAIWAERGCCQLCFGARWRECLTDDQMHEDPSRAKTRGKPKEERFNERVCGRICEACHRDITENRIAVVFEDEWKRFAGLVWAERRRVGVDGQHQGKAR